MKVIDIRKGQTFTLAHLKNDELFRCEREPWPQAKCARYRSGFYVRVSDNKPVVIAKNQNAELKQLTNK
jgi:hypothetical protein